MTISTPSKTTIYALLIGMVIGVALTFVPRIHFPAIEIHWPSEPVKPVTPVVPVTPAPDPKDILGFHRSQSRG